MNEPTSANSNVDKLVENLQQANRLIRSRAVMLTVFLILMMGFSISIKQGEQEFQSLNTGYDKLVKLFNTDSLQIIMRRDSIGYLLHDNDLGPYMSVEVLYDKLAQDSFKNKEPLYEAVNQLDEILRVQEAEKDHSTVSIGGFPTPIRPIMILAPILLLLLYHDFAIIMLYRKRLEEKMISMQIDIWQAGPETVGHYMLGFIPKKFRHVTWLWGVIQMVILFLPIVPAIYFCLYTATANTTAGGVVIVNLFCCLLIFLDFLIIVDSENVLGLKDISMIFTGKKPSDLSTKFWGRRERMALFIPVFLGLFTWYCFYDLLKDQPVDLIICIAGAFMAGVLCSTLSIVSGNMAAGRWKDLWSTYAGGAFFAALFWFVIDLLAFFGAIQFRIISPLGYFGVSIAIFLVASLMKIYYVREYLEKASAPLTDPNDQTL